MFRLKVCCYCFRDSIYTEHIAGRLLFWIHQFQKLPSKPQKKQITLTQASTSLFIEWAFMLKRFQSIFNGYMRKVRNFMLLSRVKIYIFLALDVVQLNSMRFNFQPLY